MGMEGETPEEIETTSILARVTNIHETGEILKAARIDPCMQLLTCGYDIETLKLDGAHTIKFNPTHSLVFNYTESLSKHPNGMRFCVFDGQGDLVIEREINVHSYTTYQ